MNLSVIIPTYNETDIIARTINEVRERAGKFVSEIIVVDGGSTDGTPGKAESMGAKAVLSPQKGRAAQMNYGASQAGGEMLYFLHADSLPPTYFDQQIHRAASSGFEAGCFQLTFDEDHPLLNFYGWCTQFDVDAFRFGDQSLFIRRSEFFAIDGFREDHIVMEDNEIVRRIKGRNSFIVLDDQVETSARSYMKAGVIKLQLIFVIIYMLYYLGVKQETLVDLRERVISK